MEPLEVVLLVAVGLCFGAGLIGAEIEFRVKDALHEEGKPVSWFLCPWQNFRVLRKAAVETQDEVKRERFSRLLVAWYWAGGAFFFFLLSVLALRFLVKP